MRKKKILKMWTRKGEKVVHYRINSQHTCFKSFSTCTELNHKTNDERISIHYRQVGGYYSGKYAFIVQKS